MTLVKQYGAMKTHRALKLQCKVQNYDWGLKGNQSEVGRLYAIQSEALLDEDTPYAELWIGTHESGPCSVLNFRDLDQDLCDDYADEGLRCIDSMSLKEWLSKNPYVLGDKVLQRWGAELPFLFKVLSVAKALSIQAHPDKKLAKQLHQHQPNIYKDANHKPEMALALSSFEALCGFVSYQELKQVLEDVPELHSLLGESVAKALMNIALCTFNKEVAKILLRASFTAIMSATEDEVKVTLSRIILRLLDEQQKRVLNKKEQLVLRLAEQYPGDVGVLSTFFLNYVCLLPGEALYLDANEPHAYIAGECVECMATSDNVVRAGLTEKYRDTKTLCAMLSYNQGPPKVLSGVPINPYTKRYSPPFEEFEVDASIVPDGHSLSLLPSPGPSVLLVFKGKGNMNQVFGNTKFCTEIKRGDIFFIPAGIRLDIVCNTRGDEEMDFLHLYKAGVNSNVFT
ncbi:hypothetical protein KP509_10G045900 [Ceratopteris richardii]|uniref:mannose-6-phosphate isomerase n=1 Tax=Ceratopteris richardii TaxID=49495 RepID=A0A8T2U4F8_CERRI|nr:hypothetical protein KP509_10G045900 [Ceratopteris richardii]